MKVEIENLKQQPITASLADGTTLNLPARLNDIKVDVDDGQITDHIKNLVKLGYIQINTKKEVSEAKETPVETDKKKSEKTSK